MCNPRLWFQNTEGGVKGKQGILLHDYDSVQSHNVLMTSNNNVYLAPIFLWTDDMRLRHVDVVDSGAIGESIQATSPSFGSLFVDVLDVCHISDSRFIGNKASSGGAVAIRGPGRAEIFNSVFVGNVAFETGAALSYIAVGTHSHLSSRSAECSHRWRCFRAAQCPELPLQQQPHRTDRFAGGPGDGPPLHWRHGCHVGLGLADEL